MSSARTNLTSNDVIISNRVLGIGTFRVCMEGTFVGGNRNQQAAACKRFKPEHRVMDQEFFARDFQIIDKVILFADEWNSFCEHGKEILVNRGTIHFSRSGIRYLVEPEIRFFEKFTSNNGWIGDRDAWEVRCMEAFTHFSYHKTSGQMIVADIQGRYKFDRYSKKKSRFELGDPAICSRRRNYGPADLGEKGIESFFANHKCNEYCQGHWQRPRFPQQWFAMSTGTTMMSSTMSKHLTLQSRATFTGGNLQMISEGYDSYEDYDSDEDGW